MFKEALILVDFDLASNAQIAQILRKADVRLIRMFEEDDLAQITEDVCILWNIHTVPLEVIKRYSTHKATQILIYQTPPSSDQLTFFHDHPGLIDLMPVQNVPLWMKKYVRSDSFSVQELRNALERQEFEVYYQPKICLKTNQLKGAEALIRWNHKEQGLLTPQAFLEQTQDHTFLVDLTLFIADQVFDKLKEWCLPIGMNVPAHLLMDLGFLKKLQDKFKKHKKTLTLLELEITEQSDLIYTPQIRELLDQYRRLGIGLSIDDFGAGYSSILRLLELPFSALKIDRAFVENCLTDPKSRSIIEVTIDLAKKMHLIICAEGIEDHKTADFLTQVGCDLGQGYLYAKPLNVHDFKKLYR